MKNLKKVLAVVLVIVMAFSLMAVASAAKLSDYSDAASVTQKEAVEVLTQAGVLAGSGGKFDPTGTFTREQAAKIICYLMLGKMGADLLKTSSSSFSDVAVTRWSAPFIEYCATKGVINGDGTGKFNPEATVTGTQFAKLLLAALGYGKNGEYTGSSWEINSLTDALSLGLLTLNVDYTAPATREQIAQYALNALTKTFQVYNKNTGSYENSAAATNTFALRLGLTKTTPYTQNGVSGHIWRLYTADIGFYSDETVIATSASGLPISMLTQLGGFFYKATPEADATYLINGAPATRWVSGTAYPIVGTYLVVEGELYKTTAAILATDTAASAVTGKATAVNAKGVVINFINTDLDPSAETISYTVKTVAMATGAPVVSGGTVKISGVGAASWAATMVTYPADLQAYDYVLYYTDALGITHIEKCATATGAATARGVDTSANQYLIVGGVNRYNTGLAGAATTLVSGFATTDFNKDMTVWLDDNGDIVAYKVNSTAATANYTVLLDNVAVGYTVNAKLLMTDGTVKVVNLGLVNGVPADGSATEDVWYSYAIGTDGNYNLTLAVDSGTTFDVAVINTAISRQATFATGLAGDSTTIFLFDNDPAATHGTSWTAVTGVANAPQTTATTAGQAISINGIAKYVYVNQYTGAAATPKVAYIVNHATPAYYPAVGAVPAYNEYDAIVNNEVTKIKVNAAAATAGAIDANHVLSASGLLTVTYDSYGFVTTASTTVTGLTGETGTAPGANGTIILGTTGYSYNDSTAVFYIDSVTKTVTKGTVASVIFDIDDAVAAYLTPSSTDGDMLAAIYVVHTA